MRVCVSLMLAAWARKQDSGHLPLGPKTLTSQLGGHFVACFGLVLTNHKTEICMQSPFLTDSDPI